MVQNYDSTDERLKPCPFCGATPQWHRIGNEYTKSQKIVVKCPRCRVQRTDAIINKHGHTLEWLEGIAIYNWNKRPNDPPLLKITDK